MLLLQVENNLIKTKKKDDPSGSRTLLRLHRALEYITEFLGRLEPLEDEAYLSTVSREAYEKTLMKYHPWIVQVKDKMPIILEIILSNFRKQLNLQWVCCLPKMV